MSAINKLSELQEQQKGLQQKLAILSFRLQNIHIKSVPQISIFFIIQAAFDVVIPALLLVLGSKSQMNCLQKMAYMLFEASSSDERMMHAFYGQVILFFILMAVVLVLLFGKPRRIQEICLYFLTYLHCATTFVLFLSASIWVSFSMKDQKNWVSTLGKFLSISNILITVSLCGLYKLIAHSYSSMSPNMLCPRFDTGQIVLSILTKTISVFILTLLGVKMVRPELVPNSHTIFILCECLHFATALLRFKKQAQFFSYIHQKAANIYRGCLVVELSCIFSTLVCLISQENLLNQNYVYSIGLIAVLFYLAFRAYLGQRDQQLNLISAEEIQDEQKAILFLMKLNHILQTDDIKTMGLTQMFMLKNLFKIHVQKCYTVDCFCQQVNISRASIYQMGKIYTLMGFSLMENLCQKFLGRFEELPKFILLAKLKIYRNFASWSCLIKMSINKRRKDISFKEDFFLKKYCLELQEHIQKNFKYQNITNIEKCLECDRIYQYYLQKMLQVLEYRSYFWSKLVKNQITTQFDAKVSEQLQRMIQINEINGFVVENYLNLQLITLIVGYEKNILLKQRITKEYIKNIKRLSLNHQKNKLEIYKNYIIEEIMYERFSCTIEASISQEELGVIVNTSKNIMNVFGYESKDLIGQNINKLIPSKMQDQHRVLLNKWVKTCSWDRMGQVKTTFGIMKNNVCCSCRLYLKPIVRKEHVNVIGYFMKDNDEDYMVLSDRNIIVAAGRNFRNMLGPNIINLPISLIIENRLQFNKIIQNKTSKSLHTFNFYSTKSKTNQELHKMYKGNTISLDTMKTCELPFEVNTQLKDFHNQIQSYNLKFSLSETTMGRLRFHVIKLQNPINSSENINSTYKILNESGQQQNNRLQEESNAFLNYDPSISSGNSQGQLKSTYNMIERMEKIFYKKIPIYDSRSVRLTVIVLILCVLGCGVDLGKIYVNKLGFKEMEELLFLENTYSYNIQLTMFIYNNVLLLDQHLKLYINNVQTIKDSQNLIDQLTEHLKQSKLQRDQLYNFISREITDYNRMKTSLNNINMYKFSNMEILWKPFQEDLEQKITVIMFMNNFLHFSEQTEKIILQVMNFIKNSSNIDKNKENLLRKFLLQLDKNVIILHNNFPTLERLSALNIGYHFSILKQTKSTLKLFSSVKMIVLIVIFFMIIYTFNQHYEFRSEQNYKIYTGYRYITLDYAKRLQVYLQKIGKLVKATVYSNYREDDDVEKQYKKDLNAGLMAKINKINQYYVSQYIENQNKTTVGLKLSISKSTFKLQKLLYLLFFLAIIGLNLLIKSSQQEIMTKDEQISAFINQLITSQNNLITTYFYYKAQPITRIALTQEQLVRLLSKVKTTQVQFTEIAVNSIQLLNAYDPDYVNKMRGILTESICKQGANNFNACVQTKKKNIANHGIINAMNTFSRKMENLIEEQIRNSGKLSDQLSQIAEVDLSLYFMFKVYQKIQQQITKSFSIAVNHQKTQFLIKIGAELLILLIISGFILKFYRKDKKETLFRIGKILLLPIGVIKTNEKILKNFQKAIDFASIKQE